MSIRAWVDATQPAWGVRLYGMTLLERLLRTCHDVGIREFVIVTKPGVNTIQSLRPDFNARYDISMRQDELLAAPLQHLLDHVGRSTTRVLALEADAVYDPRLIDCVTSLEGSVVACNPGDNDSPVVALLSGNDASWLESLEGQSLSASVLETSSTADVRILFPEQVKAYNSVLRTRTTPFLLRVVDEASAHTAYVALYEAVFKDSIDFVARYGYKYLVRWLVARISPTRITPDHVTWVGVLLSLLAVVFFAVGMHWAGAAILGIVVLCDSIDGKLARLTHRVDDFGGTLDSVVNFVTLEASAVAIGYHLAGGTVGDLPFLAGVVFVGAYSLDRVVCMLFKKAHKAMLYDFTPFEFRFRRFAARRTNIVFAWLVGMLTGHLLEAHYAVAVWGICTFAVHTFRALWITVRRIPPHPDLHPEESAIA